MKKQEKKVLTAFEYNLRHLIKTGQVDLAIPDKTVEKLFEAYREEASFSEEEEKQLQQQAQYFFVKKKLREVQTQKQLRKTIPFGRWIQYWREAIELTRYKLAKLLDLDVQELERLEEGTKNPLEYAPDKMAAILDLFDAHLKTFRETLFAHLETASSKEGYVAVSPRSNRCSVDLSLAIEDLLREVSDKKADVEKAISGAADFENKLCHELKKRRREDLLQ